MWIFTSTGFVSIVQHRDEPKLLIVRGRAKGDAARFLGVREADEIVNPQADYRYRILATREEVERAMLAQLKRLDYPNFKSSITRPWLHECAMSVWSIMHAAQQRLSARRKPGC